MTQDARQLTNKDESACFTTEWAV